jgi:hypothetical protein
MVRGEPLGYGAVMSTPDHHEPRVDRTAFAVCHGWAEAERADHAYWRASRTAWPTACASSCGGTGPGCWPWPAMTW